MPFSDSINIVDVIVADKKLLNATPNDVVMGKMFIGKNQNIESGNIPMNTKRTDVHLTCGETFGIPYGVNPVPYNIIVQSIEDVTPATAIDYDILENKTAWINGKKVVGKMPDNGKISIELAAGDTYNVPFGYHNGAGIVKCKELSVQTSGSADSSNILDGETAWANGKLIKGSMPNNGAVNKTLTAGDNIVIPIGYHNGLGIINAMNLADQTVGNAYDNVITSGYSAWVNGKKVIGSMPNNKAEEIILPVNGTYEIPNGYHTGKGKITQNVPSRPAMTIAPAKENQVLDVGGYFMDGDITVTGIDALNYQRSESAIKDSTGNEISNYTLSVSNNKASVIVSVDNWHDNGTLNIYKITSNSLTDINGNTIGDIDLIVMIDYYSQIPHTYKFGKVSITTSLEAETNAHKIEFNGIKSGNVTITEPFCARELNVKD